MAIGDFTVKILGACPSGDHVTLELTVETAQGLRTITRRATRAEIRKPLSVEDREAFAISLINRFTRRGNFANLADYKSQLEAQVFQI